MSNIYVSAKFANIASQRSRKIQEVRAAALEITKRERGTLQYDWFFDDQEKVCVVLETYLFGLGSPAPHRKCR